MADAEEIATMERILAEQKAQVARMEARLAAAKAAAAAPKPVAAAPVAAAPVATIVRKAPTLKAPQAYSDVIVTDKGREAGLFTKAHREQAAQYGSVRDHVSWPRFWDPSSNKFMYKSLKINGNSHYNALLSRGEVQPPRSHYFNSRTNNVIHEDTVFNAKGELKQAYANMRVKGRVLREGGKDVTVTCILYFPMTYEDEQGVTLPVTKAIYDERHDMTLLYVVDADGHYHQEQREMVLYTTEEALAPWLPAGRTWWVRGAHFEDYVSLDSIKEAPIGQASSVRKHVYGTLAAALNTFSSSLSAIQFRSPFAHPEVPTIDAMALQYHGKPRHVFSPFLEPAVNPAAKRLEDWIVPEATRRMPTEGGGQVVQVVLPSESGCGYEFIINTYSDSFAGLKLAVDASHPRGRYPDVHMTPEWLYENIFHEGAKYNKEDMGLSLQQMHLFFERFRVSLFVLDITGRLVEKACYIPESVNERLRPNSAYMLTHNEHVYPITSKTVTEQLRQYAWNANSFLWRPIHGLGKEKDGEDEEENAVLGEPSGRYNVSQQEAPVIFLPNIDALASFDVKVPKLDKAGVPRLRKSGVPFFHDRLRIAVPASMNVTLVDLVERANYQPRVTMSGLGEILSLTIKVEGVSLAISAPHHLVPEPAEDDCMPWLPTEAIHRQYCEHDAALKAALRSRATLSVYSPSLAHAFKRHTVTLKDGREVSFTPFYRSPLYYGTPCEGPVTAVDRIKSYTSLLMDMAKVPVFTEFCVFERFEYKSLVEVSDCEPAAVIDDNLSHCSDPTDTQTPMPPIPSPQPIEPKPVVFGIAREPVRAGPVTVVVPPVSTTGAERALAQLVGAAGGSVEEAIGRLKVAGAATAGAVQPSGVPKAPMSQPSAEEALAMLGGGAQPVAVKPVVVEPVAPKPRVYSERDRHSLYLVMTVGTLFPDDPKFLILDKPYCLLTYRTWAVCRDWPECHTVGVIKPFNLVKTDVAKIIKSMWDSSLPTHLKKFLPNKHVGFCGKSENRRSNTLLFESAVEAKAFKGRMEDATVLVQQLGKHTFHFVTQEWRTTLGEGFMPIHHAVLDAQRRVLYEKAVEVGKPVLGVKTDCLYFEGHDPAFDVPKRGTYDAIGTWCVEKAMEYPTKEPYEKRFEDHWLPSLDNVPKVVVLPVVNEYDANELAALFQQNNHVLVLADIPGAGKTFALKSYMATLGEAALFVTPYNALADDLVKGDNPVHCAITFHKLVGLLAHGEEGDEVLDDDGKVIRPTEFDVSKVTHIVFDELFCYSPIMLGQLKRYIDRHTFMEDGSERHFYAAGDKNQNPPIVPSCLNRLETKDYYTQAVNSIFPNQIRLQVCKRVKTEEQQQRILAIKEAVLNTNTPLLTICRRYFTPITSLRQIADGMRAVCYTNETAGAVNDYRMQRVAKSVVALGIELVRLDGRQYYVSQVLRCRKYTRSPLLLYVNFTYRVSGFERSDGGAVTGIYLEETKDFPWAPSLVRKHFVYDYANTCHSLQGLTASNGVALFDVELWCATREWLYTALTRTNDLDNVVFWDAGSVIDLPVVRRSDFQLALEAKLRGYQAQDTAAGRSWGPEEFADGTYIMELYDGQRGRCQHCQEWLPVRWGERAVNQPTLDRIDNAQAHVKGNCWLACLRCNTTRH